MNPGWIAAGIALLILLMQLFRFTGSFAEKQSVLAMAEKLQAAVVKTAEELRLLVEKTAAERHSEVSEAFARLQITLDAMLGEQKVTNGRVRKLEDWTLVHECEDRVLARKTQTKKTAK